MVCDAGSLGQKSSDALITAVLLELKSRWIVSDNILKEET